MYRRILAPKHSAFDHIHTTDRSTIQILIIDKNLKLLISEKNYLSSIKRWYNWDIWARAKLKVCQTECQTLL